MWLPERRRVVKAGTKLILLLVPPIAAIIAAFGYFDVLQSRIRLRGELAREGRTITRTAQLAIEDALRDRQLEDVHDLVDQVTGFERVFGVRLFNPDGTLNYQSATLDSLPFLSMEVLQSVLNARIPAEARRFIGREPVSSFFAPLVSPDGSLFGAVQVIQLESFIEEDARASRDFVVRLTAVTIVAISAILFLVVHFGLSRRVEELVARFRKVGSGALEARVPVRGRDEFGRLAQEFNAMCEKLESARQSLLEEKEERLRIEAGLRSTERLASLGLLSTGLAHEIGTPLNVIIARSEALQRRFPGDGHLSKNLNVITAQIDRIARILRRTLDFARPRELHKAPVDLPSLVRKVLELLEHRIAQSRILVEESLPDRLPAITADPDQLYEVFLNIVMNAADAMPRGGALSIRVTRVKRRHPEQAVESRFVAVEFEDTGCGISSELLHRVFDPFFSTKGVGQGTGLGLSVAYGIAREHGGWIEVESEEGRGTSVTVWLPEEESLVGASLGGDLR